MVATSTSIPVAVAFTSTSSVGFHNPSMSVAERMFLLQVARKQTADTSLEAAMDAMSGKLKDQQDLNTFLSGLDARAKANGAGNVHLAPEEVTFLQRVGFNCDAAGNFIQTPYHGTEDLKTGDMVRTALNRDDAHNINWADRTDNVFVPKDQLENFKKALSQHITTLSGSNEIQMLSVQRLMNSANEAMQAASSQLKSSHDIAMSIIRNLA